MTTDWSLNKLEFDPFKLHSSVIISVISVISVVKNKDDHQYQKE